MAKIIPFLPNKNLIAAGSKATIGRLTTHYRKISKVSWVQHQKTTLCAVELDNIIKIIFYLLFWRISALRSACLGARISTVLGRILPCLPHREHPIFEKPQRAFST